MKRPLILIIIFLLMGISIITGFQYFLSTNYTVSDLSTPQDEEVTIIESNEYYNAEGNVISGKQPKNRTPIVKDTNVTDSAKTHDPSAPTESTQDIYETPDEKTFIQDFSNGDWSRDQVKYILEQMGLVVEVVEVYSKAPRYQVIDQSVSPNTFLNPGDSITITTSLGKLMNTPNLVGMDYEKASIMLSDMVLTIVYKEAIFHDTILKNAVIYQSPAAGTSILERSNVEVVISKGPGAVVPNVVGKHSDEANTIFKSSPFIYDGTYQWSNTVPLYHVISQYIPGGTMYYSGAIIGCMISKGPSIAVPKFIGLSKQEALSKASDSGIVLILNYEFNDTIPAGYVYDQFPDPDKLIGMSAPYNSMHAKVSKGPGIKMPNVVGLNQEEAIDILKGLGFITSISFAGSKEVTEGIVISQTPLPDTRMDAGSNVQIKISSGHSE